MINCPNCGAIITSDKCQYCGAVFIDWSVIDMDKPVFIKFKHNNKIVRAKCIPKEVSYHNLYDDMGVIYLDNNPYCLMQPPKQEITLTLDIISDVDTGINMIVIDENVVNPDDLKDIWKEDDE